MCLRTSWKTSITEEAFLHNQIIRLITSLRWWMRGGGLVSVTESGGSSPLTICRKDVVNPSN